MYNWNIIGHQKQLEAIEHDIKHDKLTHAYLFAGPSQIGKFTIAKQLVNILQCPNNLCHECPTCVQLRKGSHADTMVLDNGKESIKIEQIREIINHLNMTGQANYKVLLIKNAERLTPEAANCLLKTLEEPPKGTIIIMTTSNVRELLTTIVSRTRLVKFNAYSQNYLVEKLQERYPNTDEQTIKQVCALSLGKTGRAIEFLENADLLASYKTMYNTLCEFLEGAPVYKKFAVIEQLVQEGENIEEFLDIFIHLLRSRLYKEDNKAPYLELLKHVEDTKKLLKRNINTRLALENLALKAS